MSRETDKEIFADAVEAAPGSRRALIESRCGGDAAQRDRLLRLLEAHERAEAFMGEPTLAEPAPPAPEAEGPEAGMRVGPYVLDRLIGEGGFGRVYLALQERPVERTVAVKILRSGVDAGASAARMEAERRVLAMMDHPNIATIFDAGRTPDGRPYFVMEYVRGEPLTAFCPRAGLSIRERLLLFERVCLAVQHAHQKGVIHRDLKPSNVLVTTVDGKPEARVIDFGISKAVEQDRDDATMLTLAGHVVGTPSYMSPEQISGTGGLDTRSDVYSLGVMLYELLTGSLPFEAGAFREGGLATIVRVIREVEPPRPSSRVLRGTADGPADRALASRLRGDLDWIVMRSIEKDPDRRYPSADALARDLRRHLEGLPVEAGPPGAGYRLRKFVGRHRGEVVAGSLAAGAVVALVVSAIVFGLGAESQRREIAQQLERSQAFAVFVTQMLSGLDPAIARGADRTLLRRMLDDAVARVDAQPPRAPEVEAEIRELLGTGLFKIAEFDAATNQFGIARGVAESSFGSDHPRTLSIRSSLAQSLAEQSRFDEAVGELVPLLDDQRRVLGAGHAETIKAEFNLGLIHRLRGDFASARQAFESVLARRTAALGPEHPDTLSVKNSLATVLGELGEPQRAVTLLAEVVAAQQTTLGPDHPHTLATRNNLAQALDDAGRPDEAIAELEAVLEIKRRVLEPSHPSMVTALNNLASAYRSAGRTEEGGAMLAEALEISLAAFGERDHRTLILTGNTASHFVRTGRPAEAVALLDLAMPVCEEVLGAEHPLMLSMLSSAARARLDLDQPALAVPLAMRLVERAQSAHGAARPEQRLLLGEALLREHNAQEALPVLRSAYEGLEAADPADGDSLRRAAGLLAEACGQLGRPDEAEKWRERSGG